MLTFEQLAELGAQVVAGRVVYQGKFVEGILESSAFIPAPGSALADVAAPAADDAPKIVSRRRVPKPAASPVEPAAPTEGAPAAPTEGAPAAPTEGAPDA